MKSQMLDIIFIVLWPVPVQNLLVVSSVALSDKILSIVDSIILASYIK